MDGTGGCRVFLSLEAFLGGGRRLGRVVLEMCSWDAGADRGFCIYMHQGHRSAPSVVLDMFPIDYAEYAADV